MINKIARIEELYESVKILAAKVLPVQREDLTQEVLTKLWTMPDRIPGHFCGAYLRLVVEKFN